MWIISFWVFPVVSACTWLAMLIAMLGVWAAEGKPHYYNMPASRTIPYISDIGASGIQPLFIAGSAVTVVFLDLSFLAERWLRHSGQLARNKGRLDKTSSIISILLSIAGAAGLILLSCFNDRDYDHLHDAFLGLFIAAYVISAIFICIEYFRIGIFYRREHRVLLASFFIKLSFVIIELSLAIAYGALYDNKREGNADAIIEWVIAFVFTFYILSFAVDLLPSVRTRRHVPQGEKSLHMQQSINSNDTTAQPQDVTYEGPLTTDSIGDNANLYQGQVVNGQRVLPQNF